MRKISLLVLICTLVVSLKAQTPKSALIDKQVAQLLSKMSLEEKAGQMTQISIETLLKTTGNNVNEPHELDLEKLKTCISKYKVGSILNVGGDAQTIEIWRATVQKIQELALQQNNKIPVLYGIDAIRGNNYTLKSELFPQQIAQAASFNPLIAKKISEISAYETRAAFIPWTFSPVLDLGRNPLWPRLWETYGEDPFLGAEMGKATIAGFQGTDMGDKFHVAACLKHYMGYSMPLSGHDRTPAWIPERELREYFLTQFAAAVKAGAKTVMVNSGDINGVPVHANKHMLTDILKGELQFKGFVVSDWQDIQYLYQRHKVAKDNKDAIVMAINAGIDMSMVPHDYTFTEDLISLVKEGKVSMARINDAVSRILRVKFELGLFNNPSGDAKDFPLFNSDVHHQANYLAASECVTLLKNTNNILPLSAGKKILVTGPAANSMRPLNGGWSRNWQGTNSSETESSKNTILEAMIQTFGKNNVDFAEGAGFTEAGQLDEVLAKAAKADVIVVCLGENSYTETPGNFDDLTLSTPQLDLARALAKTGKPLIYVLAEGRPRIISAIEPLSSAVLHSYILGNEGGNVIADVLSGKINPSGRLPYTYPRYVNSLQNYYHKYTETLELDPSAGYNPQWEFGFGLSYSSFTYSNLKLSSQTLNSGESLKVQIDVKNSSQRAGKEAVLLYVSDLVASITPEVKRLRAFNKFEIEPGQTKTVSFILTKENLSFINNDLKRVTEPGEFKVSVGGLSSTFQYK
jgi:beta-glucosidase